MNNGNYDVGENVLVPYLLDRQIKSVDYLIFSHFDSDHCKGLFSVLENLKVKNIIISKQGENSTNFKKFLSIIDNKGINLIIAKAGDSINVDKKTCIDVLWPDNNLVNINIINNNSLVFKVNYNNTSILFTGDIEEIAEKEIVNKYDEAIFKSDILKVAHHGSKTSSCVEFINNVRPKIALIGVGQNNKFGHPSEEIISRFNNLNIEIFRTDTMGEVVIVIEDNGKFRIKKMF